MSEYNSNNWRNVYHSYFRTMPLIESLLKVTPRITRNNDDKNSLDEGFPPAIFSQQNRRSPAMPTAITIQNASFESPALADGASYSGTMVGWTATGGFIFDPPSTRIGSVTGQNVYVTGVGNVLNQTLAKTYIATEGYIFQIDFGDSEAYGAQTYTAAL